MTRRETWGNKDGEKSRCLCYERHLGISQSSQLENKSTILMTEDMADMRNREKLLLMARKL